MPLHIIIVALMSIWVLVFLILYFKILVYVRRKKNIVFNILLSLILLGFIVASLLLDRCLNKHFCGTYPPFGYTLSWVVVLVAFIFYKVQAIVKCDKPD